MNDTGDGGWNLRTFRPKQSCDNVSMWIHEIRNLNKNYGCDFFEEISNDFHS